MSPAGKSSKSSRRRDKERKDHREGTGDSSAGRSRHSSGEFTPPELSPTLRSVEVVAPRPGSIGAFVSYFGSDTSRGTTEFDFSVTLIRHGKAENNSEIRQHLSSQGKSRSRNPKLTRSGICQTRQIATNALVSIRAGTRRPPDIFLKSPLRRAQMSAAWLQAAYEAVAEDWGTRCAVATLDALRECALKADGSIAGSAFPPSEYRIAGKRSTPGDEHWARAEGVDRATRDRLARRYPRDTVTARMTLMRAADLISTLAKIASGFNSRTGQKTCTIEAITHKTLAKGVLDRCRELRVSDATEFNVSSDGLQNAEAQEHTFRVSRTGACKDSLSIVCTSVRSLPYIATGDDCEEVPTLKDFDSAVREFHNRARTAA